MSGKDLVDVLVKQLILDRFVNWQNVWQIRTRLPVML